MPNSQGGWDEKDQSICWNGGITADSTDCHIPQRYEEYKIPTLPLLFRFHLNSTSTFRRTRSFTTNSTEGEGATDITTSSFTSYVFDAEAGITLLAFTSWPYIFWCLDEYGENRYSPEPPCSSIGLPKMSKLPIWWSSLSPLAHEGAP